MGEIPQGSALSVALTLDADPDANRPRPGRPEAASAGRTDGQVSLDACFEGLEFLVCLLEEFHLPAAIFWEGRTLCELRRARPAILDRLLSNPLVEHGTHGYCHEDFAGTRSGVPLDRAAVETALKLAGKAFWDAFGRPPRAFRAPYCRLTPALVAGLAASGYLYDASLTVEPGAGQSLRPFLLHRSPDLYELPLCRGRDRERKAISGYLWQLLEGRRGVADYCRLVTSVHRRADGGLLQIALHPWHLVVSAEGRRFGPQDGPPRPALVRELVERILHLDEVSLTTPGAYLERTLPRAPHG